MKLLLLRRKKTAAIDAVINECSLANMNQNISTIRKAVNAAYITYNVTDMAIKAGKKANNGVELSDDAKNRIRDAVEAATSFKKEKSAAIDAVIKELIPSRGVIAQDDIRDWMNHRDTKINNVQIGRLKQGRKRIMV